LAGGQSGFDHLEQFDLALGGPLGPELGNGHQHRIHAELLFHVEMHASVEQIAQEPKPRAKAARHLGPVASLSALVEQLDGSNQIVFLGTRHRKSCLLPGIAKMDWEPVTKRQLPALCRRVRATRASATGAATAFGAKPAGVL